MRYKGVLITFILLMLVCGAFLFGAIMYYLTKGSSCSRSGGVSFGGDVGVITVEGIILTSDGIVEELEDFRKDDDIKGVILRVDSPGGSVAASQEIYDAVKRVNKEKPVIATMGDVAASGGYYVALGAREIFANAGTITGSIGVRMEHVSIGELLAWAKIQYETLKSGAYKDMGSMNRPLTPEGRQILEAMLLDLHEQFKEAVASERKIEKATVDELADGRVYTGRQAQGLKLVDTLGGMNEAIESMKKVAKIEGEPELVEPRRRFEERLERLFDSASLLLSGRVPALQGYRQPMLMMP